MNEPSAQVTPDGTTRKRTRHTEEARQRKLKYVKEYRQAVLDSETTDEREIRLARQRDEKRTRRAARQNRTNREWIEERKQKAETKRLLRTGDQLYRNAPLFSKKHPINPRSYSDALISDSGLDRLFQQISQDALVPRDAVDSVYAVLSDRTRAPSFDTAVLAKHMSVTPEAVYLMVWINAATQYPSEAEYEKINREYLALLEDAGVTVTAAYVAQRPFKSFSAAKARRIAQTKKALIVSEKD